MSTKSRRPASDPAAPQQDGGKPSPRDSEYYRTIGKKGGAGLLKKIGPSGFRQLGPKGGAETKQRYGSDHFKRIGQQGGLQKGKNHAEPTAKPV